MKAATVAKRCKECGVELPNIWYYYSRHVKYDSDMDIYMDVLDGPFCQRCLILASTRQPEEAP